MPSLGYAGALTPNRAELRGFDFYDFGCGAGATIERVARAAPGLHGLGLDASAAKIELARSKGHRALVYDIRDIPNEELVEFVTMSHFLEHLSSMAEARAMIAKAISVARDFVLIRQPWFDADGELFQLGLKYYWSDWRGHTNRMLTLDFLSILRDELHAQRVRRFRIAAKGEVRDSRHPAVLPLSASVDQHHYQEALHGKKEKQRFRFRAFEETVIVIDLKPRASEHPVVAQLQPFEVLFSAPS